MSKLTITALAAAATVTAFTPASAQPQMRGMAMPSKSAAKIGVGFGVVKEVDPKAGTVTIQHGPIPAVGWPAMTMAFKASTPAVMRAAKVGQTVEFGVRVSGTGAEVTSLKSR